MLKTVKIINRYVYLFIISFINFYQRIISPLLPARCRYYPTCSSYGKQALAWHGVRSGSWLLLKRLSRCQPWGGHGVDFVPLPLNHYYYKFVSTIDDMNSSDINISLKIEPLKSSRLNKSTYSSVYRDDSSYVARLNDLMR